MCDEVASPTTYIIFLVGEKRAMIKKSGVRHMHIKQPEGLISNKRLSKMTTKSTDGAHAFWQKWR